MHTSLTSAVILVPKLYFGAPVFRAAGGAIAPLATPREYGFPPGPNSLRNTVRLKYCTSREYSPGEEADSNP